MKHDKKNKQQTTEIMFLLSATFLLNQSVYYLARIIAKNWQHYDMTTSADLRIPFLPWTVSIYFACYLFWCVNYYLCAAQSSAAQSSAERNRFFCADAIAKIICFLLFVTIPTTNIRPEVVGNDIWSFLMKFLYRIDAANNLFPSIHCLVSWFCWIGVRKRKELPVWYRCFSLAMAVSVCISTLTTRQHVIADVIAGIGLAEACYFIAAFPKIRSCYCVILSRLMPGK